MNVLLLSCRSVPIIMLASWLCVFVQARLARGETYHFQCNSDPKRCTQWVCPDECPTMFNGDNTVNSTCWIDCHSPDCAAQCYDWVNNVETIKCRNPGSKCSGKVIECPQECPRIYPDDDSKACYVNCDSPHCEASCKSRKPNCNTLGSACYDPRFVGGDGSLFYFHGKSNECFNLASDLNLQINGRFVGHRPRGRTRDFTWIQALGILFNSHVFSLEATKAPTWDSEIDHLRFTYDGKDVTLPEGSLSMWYSQDTEIKLERISSKNTVVISLKEKAEILVNVVPVTKKDDRVHNYQLPSDDCFIHLEVQFRFLNLSPNVDGVLGRTYRADFENQAKLGVEMPILGGEENYRTTSLLSADCKSCLFSPKNNVPDQSTQLSIVKHATLDCTRDTLLGYGIVCRK